MSAPSREYDVLTGKNLLSSTGSLMSERGLTGDGKVLVVSDSNVRPLYMESLTASLLQNGLSTVEYEINAGEQSKNAEVLMRILKAAFEAGLTRDSTIIALGGGVVGDLAGFAASVYMRGIRLIQIPTTLLSMIDSSVGGKTAVNAFASKNILGSFYQPHLVLCDTGCLTTLPDIQIASGMGEAVKYAMIDERVANALSSHDGYGVLIPRCVECKRDIVAADEKEGGIRRILNFGHTFGHAVEAALEGTLPHGHCVAIGMAMMCRACVRCGMCDSSVAGFLDSLLKTYHLPTHSPVPEETLVSLLVRDKKCHGERIFAVLPESLSKVRIADMSLTEVKALLHSATSGEMSVTLSGHCNGRLKAPASKSFVQRAVLAAALSDTPVRITGVTPSRDISAALSAVRALGAEARYCDGNCDVIPGGNTVVQGKADVGESGAVYRFMVPVCAALGRETEFALSGTLGTRPMGVFLDELKRHGMCVSCGESNHPVVSGQLEPGVYRLPGNISSQYFSGLMFALPLLKGDSRVERPEHLESSGYVTMTLDVIRRFGICVEDRNGAFRIHGSQKYHLPERVIAADADWSGASALLIAGALSGEVCVEGLSISSLQKDREIVEILRSAGASVSVKEESVSVRRKYLLPLNLDVRDIPDLVPVLSVLAAGAVGESRFEGIGRLRFKESNRVKSVLAMLDSLGVEAYADESTMVIRGNGRVAPRGVIDSFADHRIIMAASIASCISPIPVKISNCGAVAKSYPHFFADLLRLGMNIELKEAES